MIQFLRRLINSGVGVAVALIFLVLIALAFAAGDVANFRSGSASGSSVATVGDKSISATQLSQAATAALEDAKQQDPRLSMKAFVGAGRLEAILDQLVNRVAIGVFGKKNGVIASDRLVDSEINKISAFKGADGKFNQAAFKAVLQQRGLNEKDLREDLAVSLVARQLIGPAAAGATMPRGPAIRYTELLKESRSGAIALIPSAVYAPAGPPSDTQLQGYYNSHRDRFIRPERRVLRYATFGEAELKEVPAPTDAEIAAYYNANRSTYAASETRKLTQVIVPTEAAAQALLTEVRGGKKLEQAATAKGLGTAALGPLDKSALAAQSSQPVADAVFAAASGALAAPAKSALGWHVVRIDSIDKRPERSVEQARDEIALKLTETKRRAALNDLTARIEDEFENGGTLADAAKELHLELKQTPQITADGRLYGQNVQALPPVLARLVPTAFAMEREGQPQIAELEPGKTFAVFDVSAITASAAAPLAEIRDDVTTAWKLDEGAKAAKTAADKVQAAVRKGGDLGAAMTSLARPGLPPVDRINLNRQQLPQDRQQVPPPLMLMFSMAKGTVKLLPAPNSRGWYVVALKEIVPGKVETTDPVITIAQRELGKLVGNEYAEQLSRAIAAEVGVKRNQPAIDALRKQLTGGN